MTEVGAERIEQQQKDFSKLFKSLQKIIHEIDSPQLSSAFELSKNCKYWKRPIVQSFLKRHQLKLPPFHGCQFGVVDANGLPMKKGWMIATNCGWEDIFQIFLGAATVHGGSKVNDLEVVSGLTQRFTAQSMSTDALLSVPWASDLMLLSRVDLDDLWNFQLPTENVPGTSRPTVDVVPTIYVLTSDSAMALITGRGRTLKKYTIEKDLAARKAEMILEIGHEMLWGKDLQSLVKANIAMVKDLLSKYKNYGSSIRVISLVIWSGNELCGQRRSTSHFDQDMWIDLEDFFKEFNSMSPKKVTPPTVEELIALLAHDNKCRFEFRCAAGLQLATRKGLAFWPTKIRAVQGHSEKAVQKAAASDTFNATLVFAGRGTLKGFLNWKASRYFGGDARSHLPPSSRMDLFQAVAKGSPAAVHTITLPIGRYPMRATSQECVHRGRLRSERP